MGMRAIKNKPKIISINELSSLAHYNNNKRLRQAAYSALRDAEMIENRGDPVTIIFDRELRTFQVQAPNVAMVKLVASRPPISPHLHSRW